jgi:hypothetical protein
MFGLRSPSRGKFSAENLILCAQGDSRKVRFEKTEQLQKSRKKEKKVNTDDLKSLPLQKAFGFCRRNCNRVMVERALRHDVPRARIPGIVFPQGKQPAGPEATPDVIQGRHSLRYRDVMKDAIAKNHVHVSLRNKIVKGEEFAAGRSMLEAGALQRTKRYVEPDDKIQIECFAEKSSGVTYAAAVVDRGAGQLLQPLEKALQPVDPFERKIILAFATYGQSLVQFGIVRVGILVELGSGAHQLIAPESVIRQLSPSVVESPCDQFVEKNQLWLLTEEAKVSPLRT